MLPVFLLGENLILLSVLCISSTLSISFFTLLFCHLVIYPENYYLSIHRYLHSFLFFLVLAFRLLPIICHYKLELQGIIFCTIFLPSRGISSESIPEVGFLGRQVNAYTGRCCLPTMCEHHRPQSLGERMSPNCWHFAHQIHKELSLCAGLTCISLTISRVKHLIMGRVICIHCVYEYISRRFLVNFLFTSFAHFPVSIFSFSHNFSEFFIYIRTLYI